MEPLSPKNHAERVAIFRHSVIGCLLVREFVHGELRVKLEELSLARFRPPDADSTRCYAVPTLERWYYACKKSGLEALMPRARADKGHGKKLTPEMRELLCDIRTEHRAASVPTILATLQEEGRLPKDPKDEHAASPQTVRKLFAARGLTRMSAKVADSDEPPGAKMRLKWQASHPGALWHGDVCHFAILVGGVKKPVRIHAHLDDASRYIVAIEVFWTEREEDMLTLFIDAVRVHGPCDALYLDNGSTYRGEVLITVCHRLGIVLLHAKPYDPQARGKMERFWRTLREQALVFCTGEEMTLEELNRRLRAFVERYHETPHAGLMGKTPASVYRAHQRTDDLDEHKLQEALTVRETRRVSPDNLVRIDGKAWELDQSFLAGKRVTIVRRWLTPDVPPSVELEGKLLPLHRVDPVHNAKRPRPAPEPQKPARPGVAFNPVGTLLKGAKKGGT
jgi:transposase InsO family protein